MLYSRNFSNLYRNDQDFPGGSVVKSPPSKAVHASSTPSGGTKIPHAKGLLSPQAITREKPECSKERLWMPYDLMQPKINRLIFLKKKDII